MWDAWSVALGASFGLSLGGLLWWVWARRLPAPEPRASWQLTAGWRIGELPEPIVVVRRLLGVPVPRGATVFASEQVDADVLTHCTVHMVPEVNLEFAAAGDWSKAIIFTAGAEPDAVALVTHDAQLLERLRTDWRRLESRGGDYVERLRVEELAGKAGVTVETQGVVQDVLPYQDRYMMRVEDNGAIIGVVVSKDPEGLEGERIRVQGRVAKEASGYLALHATDVRRLR